MQQSLRSSPAPPSTTRVVTVPSSDTDFARFVRDVAAHQADVAALEARLRQRYPRARVHPNELSGRDAVWYAYRDGRWESSRHS